MSSADEDFILKIVENDIYANGESSKKLLAALKASSVPRTPSEFGFSLDYTNVPVSINIVPVAELKSGEKDWDATCDSIVERASQSVFHMVVKAHIRRGALRAFILHSMNAPSSR